MGVKEAWQYGTSKIQVNILKKIFSDKKEITDRAREQSMHSTCHVRLISLFDESKLRFLDIYIQPTLYIEN